MTFSKDSAFGQEAELHRLGDASAKDRLAETIGQTIQSAARSPHVAKGNTEVRELIDEMVREAAEDVPDQERFERLAQEAKDAIDGTSSGS